MDIDAGLQRASDQELFDLLKENNQAAFTEIYDRYKEVLHRYAYKWLQDRDAVKDVIQDLLRCYGQNAIPWFSIRTSRGIFIFQ